MNATVKSLRCARILVLDRDPSTMAMIQPPAPDIQYEVRQLTDPHELEKVLHTFRPDVVILSADGCGQRLGFSVSLSRGRSADSTLKLLQAFGNADRMKAFSLMLLIDGGAESSATAIELLALGATDCVAKPIFLPQLTARLSSLLEARQLLRTPTLCYQASEGDHEIASMVGRCDAMMAVYRGIGVAARCGSSVLIRGECGTGKTLAALTIHRHSGRPAENVRIIRGDDPDVDEIPALLSAGAAKTTLIVEDVDLLPRPMQGRLLGLIRNRQAALAEDSPFATGPSAERAIDDADSAIVMTMQSSLGSQESVPGTVRHDLFYELRGGLIDLPPLRDRGGDLELLVEHFVSRLTRTQPIDGHRHQRITADALSLLCQYSWPGNIAELRSTLLAGLQHGNGVLIANDQLRQATKPMGRPALQANLAFERSAVGGPAVSALPSAQPERVVHSPEPHVQLRSPEFWASTIDALVERAAHDGVDGQANDKLITDSKSVAPSFSGGSPHAETVEAMETGLISAALRRTGGNLAQSARLLGMTRVSLRKKIHSLGLVIPGRGVST